MKREGEERSRGSGRIRANPRVRSDVKGREMSASLTLYKLQQRTRVYCLLTLLAW